MYSFPPQNMGSHHSTSKHEHTHIPRERNYAQELPRHSQQHSTHVGNASRQSSVSFRIIKHVAQFEARGSNLVFSPLSIQLILGLVAAGATGPTQDQILSFLNCESINNQNQLASELGSKVLVDSSSYGGPKLCFANGVWIDNTLALKPTFNQIASNKYNAACKQVDFLTKANEVTREANSWVANSTQGLIKDILPPGSVDKTTRLILANALYFKGIWKQKFDPSRTQDLDFYLLNGGSVKAPFMSSMTKQYISTFNDFKVLRLCYSQGRDSRQFSMYIFLPDAMDGLPSLMQMASSQPGFLEQHFPHHQVEVDNCMIPRFKISFHFEASRTLKQLGLTRPFSEGGLTEMVESSLGEKLFVSSIFHKSFIEVNEEGTEAAAATTALVGIKSINLTNKINFVANHAFLFFIREDTTGTLVFAGQMLNPQLQH